MMTRMVVVMDCGAGYGENIIPIRGEDAVA